MLVEPSLDCLYRREDADRNYRCTLSISDFTNLCSSFGTSGGMTRHRYPPSMCPATCEGGHYSGSGIGVDAETIAERKFTAPWGQWLLEECHTVEGPTSATQEAAEFSQDVESADEGSEHNLTSVLHTISFH